MKESTSFHRIRRSRRRGQSLAEFALMAPILLIILSGLFEFGFIFNHYLAVLDAARNSSRFSSDNWFNIRDVNPKCSDPGGTKDFYRQAACLAVIELEGQHPTIELCLPPGKGTDDCPTGVWEKYDDIIVSVFSVWRDGGSPVITRFPAENGCPEYGWSYAADLDSKYQCDDRTGLHASQFSDADIIAKLETVAPNTGFVLVEINNNYNHVLGLPWFTQFIGDPIKLYVYALWPLVSAEPTSTPKP